jgi:hypothetical protein
VNEAMFVGSPGWIEKPLHMRKGSEHIPILGREKLIGEVVGVSSRSSFFPLFSPLYLTIDVIFFLYALSASSERTLGQNLFRVSNCPAVSRRYRFEMAFKDSKDTTHRGRRCRCDVAIQIRMGV